MGRRPEQVAEGGTVTYDLTVVNNGPDTATGIALHATSSLDFVAVETSQDKCRMEANNVYCSFASLAKGQKISVKIVEKCSWDRYFHDRLPDGRPEPVTETASENKSVDIQALERDPVFENNR